MASPQDPAAIDWHAVYNSPEFARLAARRGRFVRLAVAVLLGWFAVFMAVLGVAPGLAGQVAVAGMTLGFLLGLSQFVLAWALTWRYLKLSTTVFAELEDAVVAVSGGSTSEARL